MNTAETADATRSSDFITVRSIQDEEGKEVHDYTAQLG